MNVNFDHFRPARIGLPESIFCLHKDVATVERLFRRLVGRKNSPVLLTKLSESKFEALKKTTRAKLDYDPVSETAFLNGVYPKKIRSRAAVVTAGSSDHPVALEAARTLEYLGISSTLFPDIGVAGLWRLEKCLDAINACRVVIVVAGMDAAIVSVLGGLTGRPLIAVPSSVGYGVAEEGRPALGSMLASCAPGIAVVNINNGYGAACAAYRILSVND